ncbi:MAG TPA: glycosyltransferase family 2 protein [Anaerolineales bacterium]|nr:glycosyltransferase family 2 protein [Anaerolineales bacterium]
MEKADPFFSVIILCWNSNQTIQRCLESLNVQTERDFEVLLIDNGSTEPISQELISSFTRLSIQLFRLQQNIGFAAGNNYGAARAKGAYLVLLNSDAFPATDWLQNIRKAIRKYPDCFFASKLIMANHPERMDGMGDVYHVSGLMWRKANNSPVIRVRNVEGEVFSACGAAAVYPMETFNKVNGFDEDFISYAEDTDLSFRLRLLGYHCIYLPDAMVYHIGSGSTWRRSDLSVYYGHRNLVWTYVKNMPGAWLWLLAPIHLVMNLMMIVVGVTRGQGKVMLRAKMDALRGLPVMWKKRSQIQRTRRVAANKLIQRMDWNPFSPVIRLFRK